MIYEPQQFYNLAKKQNAIYQSNVPKHNISLEVIRTLKRMNIKPPLKNAEILLTLQAILESLEIKLHAHSEIMFNAWRDTSHELQKHNQILIHTYSNFFILRSIMLKYFPFFISNSVGFGIV